MDLIAIEFSEWVKWRDRAIIKNANGPGVYLLAKFNYVPEGSADPTDKHIVYFGETCNNSLIGRWHQFNRSAFESKDGHSGGWTYNDTYKDKGDDLYVAALAVSELPDNIRHLFIRYVERKLMLDYAIKHGIQPVLNRK